MNQPPEPRRHAPETDDELDRALDDWGRRTAEASITAMPSAIGHAVRARGAPARRYAVVFALRAGAGLALAAVVALAVIIWSRAQHPGAPQPLLPPQPIADRQASPYTLLAIARANRDADPESLVLPDPPPGARARAGEVVRLGPARLGG